MRLTRARLMNVIAALLIACTARGADFPRLPQAVSAAEMARFSDLLSLSAEQRIAVERQFEDYLDAFEPLRGQMIEVAVQYPGEGSDPADREFLRRVPAFVASVRELDASFFSNIEALLTDAQRAALPHVQLLRERTLYANLDATARFIGTNVPDLRELIESLARGEDLPPPVRVALDRYEQRLTAGIRAVFEAAIRVCTTDQPQAAEQLIERVRTLRAMNRQSCRELCSLLSPELSRRLKDAFNRRAYDQAVESTTMFVLPRLHAAMALPGLSAGARQSLERIGREAEQFADEMVERLAVLMDAEAINIAPPQGAVGSPDFLDHFNKARSDTMMRDREFRAELENALGPERAELLKDVRPEYVQSRSGLRMRCGIVSYASAPPRKQQGVDVPHWRIDPLHAPPITREEMEDYSSALGLSDDARDRALALHHDYVKQLEEQLKPLRHSLAVHTMYGRHEERAEREPTERARAAKSLRDQIRTHVENADAALFENLRSIASASDASIWEAVIRLRGRTRIMLDFPLRGELDPNRSAEIDIMRFLLRLANGAPVPEPVQVIAANYEGQFQELLRARFDMHSEIAFESLARRDGWVGADDRVPPLDWYERHEQLHQLHQRVANFNMEQNGLFVDALPAHDAESLQQAFNRAAYLEAYRDPANMEPSLRRAMDLPDLTAAQREEIGQLLAAFIHDYESVRDRIVKASAAFPPDVPMIIKSLTPERTAASERFNQTFAKLADERAAVNRAALRGLRVALQPTQLRRVSLPQIE